MPPEAIRAELEAIKQRAEGRKTLTGLPMLQTELERIRKKYEEDEEEEEKDFLDIQTNPQRERERQKLLDFMRDSVFDDVVSVVKDAPIKEGSPEWNEIADRVLAIQEGLDSRRSRPEPKGETITQAAEHWFAELERTNVRPQTL